MRNEEEQQTKSKSFPWKFPFLVVGKEFRLIFHRHIRINSVRISIQQFLQFTCLCKKKFNLNISKLICIKYQLLISYFVEVKFDADSHSD